MMPTIPVDTVIIGGGPAGLWTLHELVRRGRDAILLESDRLGSGQTIASQGIIHGGLKYTLNGLMTGAAQAIRDMPERWRDALVGKAQPDLSATRLRSQHCHLWRTASLSSRLGMVGAKAGLRVKPRKITGRDVPEALSHVASDVYRLDEQVIDPASFLAALSGPLLDRIVRVDPAGFEFVRDAKGLIEKIEWPGRATFAPRQVVLTAGLGNANLRELAGLGDAMMQRRAVHMILARGERLPDLNGHCVDGNKTRVTITTDRDSAGRTVWQIGGQVSEDGTEMSPEQLIPHAIAEVGECLSYPEYLSETQWSTYRLDKAEVMTAQRTRPDDAFTHRQGNVITAWPTKLALVPRLADRVAELIDEQVPVETNAAAALSGFDRPTVALPPWETERNWTAPQNTMSTATGGL
jgi:glycerol-3-phosphate dehydrogenase